MIVVLIIGVLVSIAIPVYTSASASAQANSCQANQRTIEDAVAIYVSQNPGGATSTPGQLMNSGGSGVVRHTDPGLDKVGAVLSSGPHELPLGHVRQRDR